MKLEFEDKKELKEYLIDYIWCMTDVWELFDKYINELECIEACADALPETAFYHGAINNKKELVEEMKSNVEFHFMDKIIDKLVDGLDNKSIEYINDLKKRV